MAIQLDCFVAALLAMTKRKLEPRLSGQTRRGRRVSMRRSGRKRLSLRPIAAAWSLLLRRHTCQTISPCIAQRYFPQVSASGYLIRALHPVGAVDASRVWRMAAG